MRKLILNNRLSCIIVFLMLVSVNTTSRAQLYNPNHTAAQNKATLMQYLNDVYRKQIISGQMNDSYLNYILTTTGKEPAMMGYDFDGICPSQTKGNGDAAKAINWVKNRGGIAQFNWHWISPDANGDYYTTNFNLANALANTNSDSYKNIVRDIDLAAVELKKLKDAGVAVIWRPLHEAEGKWFWWGMSGGNACIDLYRLMYDRFKNVHQLDNLIWAWTSYGTTKGESWYPGDDVVDLIVWDYPDYNKNSGSWVHYNQLFGSRGKLFGIGEDGTLFNPDLFESQPWLYFLTWSYMVQEPTMKDGKNTKEWLLQVYNDPRVITLEDLKPANRSYAGYTSTHYDENADGQETINLDGSLSKTVNNDQITAYNWYKNDVLIATGINPEVTLPMGTHIIKLTITTSSGDSKSAFVIKNIKKFNLALNKPVNVSATESNFGNVASNANDGNSATRWSSTYSDPHWLQIDLGSKKSFDEIVIHWQNASAKNYTIQQSDNEVDWSTLIELNDMQTGTRIDTLKNLTGNARYIRMYGTARTTKWGYSIFEFEVYGKTQLSLQSIEANKLKIHPTIIAQNESIQITCSTDILPLNFSVVTINGQLIQKGTLVQNTNSLSLNGNLQQGIYFIKFMSGLSSDTRKILIKN